MTTAPLVLREDVDGVAIVRFNRPERNNAWLDAMGEEYFARLRACDADPTVRAVVVTGAGRAFCVGGDAEDLDRFGAIGRLQLDTIERTSHWATTRLSIPVVAAINGGCAGIGLVQALMCDVRFAAPRARFSTAYAQRGLAAEQGISWLLPRMVGINAAFDLLLSARRFDAAEAERLGLVTVVGDDEDVVEVATRYARTLATTCSPTAMATIKRQVWDDLERTLAASAAAADLLSDELIGGEDFAEGVRSLLEGRDPHYGPTGAARTTDRSDGE